MIEELMGWRIAVDQSTSSVYIGEGIVIRMLLGAL